MKIQHEQGYLIVAIDNDQTDYVACARALAASLKYWHPGAKICLLTETEIDDPIFDIIKKLPHGDRGGWANDWQCFFASPFRETVKLEADTLVASPIDHWWQMYRHREVTLTVGCYDYLGRRSAVRKYRKVFDDNALLDVYNAVTYWRLGEQSREFFLLVKHIFNNWSAYMQNLTGGAGQEPNTDLAYALAAELLGKEKFYIPGIDYPRLVHMKPAIVATADDWHKELTWEIDRGGVRINGHAQTGLVHYVEKNLANDFIRHYQT